MRSAAEFFDAYADRFDTFYDGQRGCVMRWLDHHFRRDVYDRFALAFAYLGDLNGKRVLDVGCGSGTYLAEASRRGAALAVGIDPAPRMLELARRRAERLGIAERIRLIEGSFPEAAPGSVDVGMALGVMDYVPDPLPFLTALLRCVSEKVVVTFPSTHWFRTPVRRFRYRRRCPLFVFQEADVRALIRDAGAARYHLEKIPGAGSDYFACIDTPGGAEGHEEDAIDSPRGLRPRVAESGSPGPTAS